MKKKQNKQCSQCSVKSQWIYFVRIPSLTEYPLYLCDDCLLYQYHDVNNKKKVEVIG